MTLFRGTFLDTPDDPFAGGALRADSDGALLVQDGVIVARGPYADLRRQHPGEDVVDLSGGLVLPGFVDTHVHFPQARVIGALGMPLLDWLDQCALPEEARMADLPYAVGVASDFVRGLVAAGTTSALVFGAHNAPAVDALFTEASRVGVRVTSGLVVGDRRLLPPLHTTPERAYAESLALAGRWHGVGRNRYAVTPRFSLSSTDDLLAACGAVLSEVPGAMLTSHVNENPCEIAAVGELFGGSSYVDTYDKHGLVGPRTVLAHNVHATDPELAVLASRGAAVAHCPTSNAALGSGLFPLARHLSAGVRVALGSDVGAGTGFSLLKEGLQAYFAQQLLGELGHPLTAAHLLHLATSAGAAALGLDEVGDFSVGKRFDAQWLCPAEGSTLDVGLAHASDAAEALARTFALGTPADVRTVWVDGDLVSSEDSDQASVLSLVE
ncbi:MULTISPECIES: guanine deaminase [unclassified Nocardioides]|uniref:guanine deaminase n=1 Tax=unclassified Nocardioides TaxID=2615069 RepID=UPI0006FD5B3B|nr:MULTISPECIES: guanine deaminase [unclassified Nocardioides]KQY63613.1 guanine deaminase [Nocardioides sp. Root140]KRF15629.1 guanine deaminase [Nocardioides sp. Soil796]